MGNEEKERTKKKRRHMSRIEEVRIRRRRVRGMADGVRCPK